MSDEAREAARRIVGMLETSASFPDLIEELNCWGPEICRDHQRQAAEIERLRAALLLCAEFVANSSLASINGIRRPQAVEAARAALSPLPAKDTP